MAPSNLLDLLWTIGPSGHERRVAQKWMEQAETFADYTDRDAIGNQYAMLYSGEHADRSVAIVGHLDEIGVIVQSIDDNGVLWIAEVGGWDPQVLVGQRITLIGRQGLVYGVIGRKAIHLMESDEIHRATKLKELWIDIGATDKADAERVVRIGDVGVIDVAPMQLPNGRLAARALDNRIGAYVALEVLRRLKDVPERPEHLTAIGSSLEEVGLRGARVAGEQRCPEIAFAVDVTHATDVGDADKKQLGDHPLGSGPVLLRNVYDSPVVFELLRDTAERFGIPHTIAASGFGSWTDGDALSLCSVGTATSVVSVPIRYMHSPNELCDVNDIENTVVLLVETIKRIDGTINLTER
jgi:putative aminopeptidase FrvX